MVELKNDDLLKIVGGWSITGTLINALVGAGKFIYSTGQALGSSLRRIGSNNVCPLR